MKVLALNSSPHKADGGTGLILGHFVEGARASGGEVDIVHLHGLAIEPCLGCLKCWTGTPGCCIQRDAMDELLPRIAAADALVYATPLYVDGMNGTMKTLLDRSIPLIEPWFEVRNDHCRHPRRPNYKVRKIALVSASGFTELDNFDALVTHVKAACLNMGCDFAGAILRPYAASLPEIGRLGVPVADVYAACAAAGAELVRDGAVSAQTMARIGRDLVPRSLYIQAVNQHFRAELGRRKNAPSA